MTTQGEAGGAGDSGDPGDGDAAAPGDPGGSSAPDDAVPRLPRGRGIRLSRPELLRVIGLAGVLVFLIVTQRPCANAVSSFVTSFGDRGSAAATLPHPGTVDLPGAAAGSATHPGSGAERYEHLRPGMTDAEVKAVIERARAKPEPNR